MPLVLVVFSMNDTGACGLPAESTRVTAPKHVLGEVVCETTRVSKELHMGWLEPRPGAYMSTARVPLEEPAGEAAAARVPPPPPTPRPDDDMDGGALGELLTDRVVDGVGVGDGRAHAALEVDPAGAVLPEAQGTQLVEDVPA